MAASGLPRTAVVVLNWNGLDWTRECLAALLAQAGPPFEVHVVDNGSQGGEADALQREYGERIVLHRLPENRGFAGGCNAALAEILATDRCGYAALLNNDAVAEPGWLAALVAAAQADPQIGICASRMVFHADPGTVENAGVFVLSNGDAVPRGRHEKAESYAHGCDLLAACGGAVLLRLQMLRSIGTFRDEFFANFEDLDLSLRAAATGWRTRYVPAAVVRHHLNVTIRKVRDRAFDVRSVRNATWAWLVNTPLPVIVLNLPWFVLCNLGIVLCMPLLGRPAVARAFVQGRWQAWRERGQVRAARRALRPLRRGSWLALWWRQRSWLLEYARLLLQRLRGRRTTGPGAVMGVLRLLFARKGESWWQLTRLFCRSLLAEGPRATWRRLASYANTVGTAAASPLPPRSGRSFALFVAGCPGHPRRWRCEHALEQLARAGLQGDILDHPAADLSDYLERYEVFVLQRVPMDPSVERFLERARARGRRVLADVDDLVVDGDCSSLLPFAGAMTALARELYEQQLRRIGEVLRMVGECMVPTRTLADEVRARHPHLRVHVVRNVASAAMVAAADAAMPEPDARGDSVTFGYFSGTPTHQQDLDAIAEALAEVFTARPDARLLLVGPIEPPAALHAFAARIDRRAAVPWAELPRLLRTADVHLVPLLSGNRFNAAKSELKYVEAALVGRPVVAAALGPFPDCIRHGDNGMLAADPAGWRQALLQLAGDPALRQRMGANARVDALARWTTATSGELAAVLAQRESMQER